MLHERHERVNLGVPFSRSASRTRDEGHAGRIPQHNAGERDESAAHPSGQGYLSKRDNRRSASSRPPVWHVGQYVIS